MAEAVPIIIKKKKGGHGGHHGGAWKVAYADFVTAMMALFIVLWLMSSSDQVKKAVGGYFKDPTGTGKLLGSAMAGSGESLSIAKDDMKKLKEKIETAIKAMPKFEKFKDNLEMTITGEGLRLDLMESEHGMFFVSGSAEPTDSGKELLDKLEKELAKLPNPIVIEGHTDSKPFSNKGTYSNWELSTDRANAARRFMQEQGLPTGRITQVRGFADQSLHDPKDPESSKNRRVSVIVQYLEPTREAEPVVKPGAKPAAETAAKPDAKPEPAEHHE
jgi:chemotaxis protein MotB